MTLGELKEMIQDLERTEGDDILEKDIYAEYNYGDHCRTRAIVAFQDIEVKTPYETAYSDSGLAIRKLRDEDEDDYIDSGLPEVLVLTSTRN